MGTSCSDGDFCAYGDSWSGGVGSTCTGNAFECDDALACTDDACAGDNGCAQTILEGWCVQAGRCERALGGATNRPVSRVEPGFLRAGGPAVISPVPHLDEVLSNVRAIIEREAEVGSRP